MMDVSAHKGYKNINNCSKSALDTSISATGSETGGTWDNMARKVDDTFSSM